MTSFVEARQVAIDRRIAPSDVVLDRGTMVALIGPNGAGKTSLLRALARVEGATGTLRINGEDVDSAGIPRRSRLLSFVPAAHQVQWPIPVRDYLALGGHNPMSVPATIDIFALEKFADRPANSLSTGEITRTMIARAMGGHASLHLFDEPLSNLDPYWTLRLLDQFRRAASAGATLMITLHDLTHLDRFERILVMSEGAIAADANPATIIGSGVLEQVFGVAIRGGRVVLRPEDRRSSP